MVSLCDELIGQGRPVDGFPLHCGEVGLSQVLLAYSRCYEIPNSNFVGEKCQPGIAVEGHLFENFPLESTYSCGVLAEPPIAQAFGEVQSDEAI
jgi:hypothetical protein